MILRFEHFALLFAFCSFFLTSSFQSIPAVETKLQRYEFSEGKMGTLFRVIFYTDDSVKANAAAQAVFARVDSLNQILSDYQSDSELNQLSLTSGSDKKVRVSDDLWHVLTIAYQVSKESDGAFDVTVGPFVKLWRRARRRKELPEKERISQAQQAVGYTKILLDSTRQTVQLVAPHMMLDLGGIAKGYALDEALKVLQRFGIHAALVDGGGDIVVSDPPPGEKGWRIEIEKTSQEGNLGKEVIWLQHAAVASSGDTYQYLEIGGKRYSHIINPKTGVGLTSQIKATVVAPTGTLADAYASTVSVLGQEKGFDFLKNKKDTKAFIVHTSIK